MLQLYTCSCNRLLSQAYPVQAMSGTPPSPTSSVEARNRTGMRVRPAGGGAFSWQWRQTHPRWLPNEIPREKKCFWCAKYCGWYDGRGNRPFGFSPTPDLMDSSTIGLVCRTCLERYWPPHLEYVQKLIGPSLNGESNLAHIISEYAYPVCSQPFSGFCFKCEPYWVGWTCPVCERADPNGGGYAGGTGRWHDDWARGTMWANERHHGWINRGNGQWLWLHGDKQGVITAQAIGFV